MQDENEAAAVFCSGGDEFHWLAFRDDDAASWAGAGKLDPAWSFEAGFAGFGVEDFGSGVDMGAAGGAGGHDGLCVLGGVVFAGFDGDGADLGCAFGVCRLFKFWADGEEPSFAEAFQNRAVFAFRLGLRFFRGGAVGEGVEGPVDLGRVEGAEGLAGEDPAALISGAFGEGLAGHQGLG